MSKVKSVSWSPDGRRLASGSFEETARVWDAESGAFLEVIEGMGDVAQSPEPSRRSPGAP